MKFRIKVADITIKESNDFAVLIDIEVGEPASNK